MLVMLGGCAVFWGCNALLNGYNYKVLGAEKMSDYYYY